MFTYAGKLTVICGPMFAGKTEALIERARTVKERKVYKPTIDTRHGDGVVVSHGGMAIEADWIDPDLECAFPAKHVFIDEAQFLRPPAVEKVLLLIRNGSDVTLAGLSLTAKGHPFGSMPEFLCLADEVVKLSGNCARCSRPSNRSKSLTGPVEDIAIGGAEAYEPRCLICFENVV